MSEADQKIKQIKALLEQVADEIRECRQVLRSEQTEAYNEKASAAKKEKEDTFRCDFLKYASSGVK